MQNNMDTEDKPPSPLWGRIKEKIKQIFPITPQSRGELLEVLSRSKQDGILDQEALDTIQRIMGVADLRARDIMVPRAKMVALDREWTLEQCLETVIPSGHSRFPVIDAEDDEITGILLAKDILRHFDDNARKRFNLHDLLRPAVFIPESKRLNVLLAEFRSTRNHMAIVVDEYGGNSGLVTIEDVLEQIVGEIDDEHDIEDEVKLIRKLRGGNYVVKAILSLEEFNQHFGTHLSDARFDTIGGLVLKQTGHVPQRGETLELAGMDMEIVHADRRRIHLIRVAPKQSADTPAQ